MTMCVQPQGAALPSILGITVETIRSTETQILFTYAKAQSHKVHNIVLMDVLLPLVATMTIANKKLNDRHVKCAGD